MTPPAAASPRTPLVRIVIAAVLVGLVVLGLRTPLTGYVLSPGPLFALSQRISIEGAEAVNGEYLFTTVQLDDATVGRALATLFNPHARLVSDRAVLGGLTEEAFIAEQEAIFADAQAVAVALALDLVDVDLDSDAVVIDNDGVGGPSAGLLVALAVADLASPDDIARGRSISGTGAVSSTGRITAVGGLSDKLRAAEDADVDLFLLPRELLPDAEAIGADVTLVPVSTLEQAVSALLGY